MSCDILGSAQLDVDKNKKNKEIIDIGYEATTFDPNMDCVEEKHRVIISSNNITVFIKVRVFFITLFNLHLFKSTVLTSFGLM